MSLPDASAAIEQWLPGFLRALKGSIVGRNKGHLFYHILQELRETRDELPGLILQASKT